MNAPKVAVYDQPTAELTRAAAAVAMTSPKHLKDWLNASGRRYIIMVANDLVDALPWPGGVEAFTQVVECYRQHRAVEVAEEKPCPKCCGQKFPNARSNNKLTPRADCMTCNGAGVERRYKGDVLEPGEMKHAVQFLIDQIRKTEPNWSP